MLATQNPIESEGTYNLPEAQLDRFMFKMRGRLSGRATRKPRSCKLHSQQVDVDQRLDDELATVTSPEEIVAVTHECGEVRVDDKLFDYINTHRPPHARSGRSSTWALRREPASR